MDGSWYAVGEDGRGEEDVELHPETVEIQRTDVSPGLRTSCYEGHGFLTSLQLSCQHPRKAQI